MITLKIEKTNRLEEFDVELYEMHSPNNMQSTGQHHEISDEEQQEINQAFN